MVPERENAVRQDGAPGACSTASSSALCRPATLCSKPAPLLSLHAAAAVSSMTAHHGEGQRVAVCQVGEEVRLAGARAPRSVGKHAAPRLPRAPQATVAARLAGGQGLPGQTLRFWLICLKAIC